MKKYFLILCCVFAILKANSQTVHNDSAEYTSVELEKDDRIFLSLKDTAQKHLQIFIDSLNQHGKDYKNYRFLVKSDFVSGDDHEHMWSRIFEYKDGIFKGVFIDSPFTVKAIKMGDRITIDRMVIEDWFIENAIDGKTTGGFSINYLESKKKPDD